eukprot:1985529-Prymnesium_polylepis.2
MRRTPSLPISLPSPPLAAGFAAARLPPVVGLAEAVAVERVHAVREENVERHLGVNRMRGCEQVPGYYGRVDMACGAVGGC